MPVVSPDFEEKEYEGALHDELFKPGRPRMWTPGQVLESRLGFDACGRAADAYWKFIFKHRWIPWPRMRRQVFVRDLLSFYGVERSKTHSRVGYSANLFVQAKRPRAYVRGSMPNGYPRTLSKNASVYAFKRVKKQQVLLQSLAEFLNSKRATSVDVCYAAPCFHEAAVLEKHAISGCVMENSSFPHVSALAQHDHWAYESPGASGFGLSDPEEFSQQSLLYRIENMRSNQDAESAGDGIEANLSRIESALAEAFRKARLRPLISIAGNADSHPSSIVARITINLAAHDILWAVIA